MNGNLNNVVQHRLSKAQETLEEAHILADTSHWNACVNRLYYACFYAVSALLIQNRFSSSKHSGVRSFFNFHFVKPGKVSKEVAKIYNDLFERRQEGDYEDFITFETSDVISWISEAELFVKVITELVSKGNE